MRIDPALVSLREITAGTVFAVIDLSVSEHQSGYVATNAESLAQALFSPTAWYRAIYLGDEPVGFVMLDDASLNGPIPEVPELSVWRFMIDQKFQRRGIGRAALQLILAHARTNRAASTLTLSYVPGPGSPEAFYRGLGFTPTGVHHGKEVELSLSLVE